MNQQYLGAHLAKERLRRFDLLRGQGFDPWACHAVERLSFQSGSQCEKNMIISTCISLRGRPFFFRRLLSWISGKNTPKSLFECNLDNTWRIYNMASCVSPLSGKTARRPKTLNSAICCLSVGWKSHIQIHGQMAVQLLSPRTDGRLC